MREASGVERERLLREDDRKEPAVLPRPHSHLNECATGPYRCEAQRRQQRAVVAVADDLLERRGGHGVALRPPVRALRHLVPTTAPVHLLLKHKSIHFISQPTVSPCSSDDGVRGRLE